MTQVAMIERIPTSGLTQQEEEAFWDELVAWCEEKQLFIGGSVDGAVIYSPFEGGLQKQRKALRRMLGQRIDLDANGPSVVSLAGLRSPRLRRDCLEAVSQAQRHLGERMIECADSLAALSSSYSTRLAVAVVDGKLLDIRWPGKQLMLQLSRLDGRPEPSFERFRSQRMRPGDLEDLIPDWPALRWNPQPPISDLSRGEWTAESAEHRIQICGEPNSSLDHRQVMQLFTELMNDG